MSAATWREFGRFLAVGASNTLISYVVFEGCMAFLPAMGAREGVSQFLAYAVGTVCAYLMHGRYTFRQRHITRAGFGRYAAIQAVLAVVTALVLQALARAGLPVRPSWVGVTMLAAVANYAAVKRLVFAVGLPGAGCVGSR